MSDQYADIEDAIEWVMQSQNCSRTEAIELLGDAIATGEVRATGISSETGKRERIMPRKPS